MTFLQALFVLGLTGVLFGLEWVRHRWEASRALRKQQQSWSNK